MDNKIANNSQAGNPTKSEAAHSKVASSTADNPASSKVANSKVANSKVALLKEWIDECPAGGLVFLGGAGVSTESGIPDFRSADGLYSQHFDYPPETIISHSFFMEKPAEFFDFYCSRMLPMGAQPNNAHKALAALEQRGILRAVITQNIDGLHQAAGSEKVFELHGSVLRNFCMRCGRFYTLEELLEAKEADPEGIPHCSCRKGGRSSGSDTQSDEGYNRAGNGGVCGGIIKPDVVLYEESLDADCLDGSLRAVESAHMMIVAGTSLSVYPAASLLHYFTGEHLVIINRDPTPKDNLADLVIADKVGEVLGKAVLG